jgi:hypothetical protein
MRQPSAEGVQGKFADAATIAKLAPIVDYLQAAPNNFGSESISAPILAKMTADLIVFCEHHLGVNGAHKGSQVKLPAGCFDDFRAGGALSTILAACFNHKIAGEWPSIDFQSDVMSGQLLGMLAKVEGALKEAQLVSRPVCYISGELPAADALAVRQILQAKGTEIVDTAEEATHTIGPDPAGTSAADTAADSSMRELERQECADGTTKSCVHWWYFPDSCAFPPPNAPVHFSFIRPTCSCADDEWIPSDQIQNNRPAAEGTAGRARWLVQKRWVDDLAKFNEYMNPIDVS